MHANIPLSLFHSTPLLHHTKSRTQHGFRHATRNQQAPSSHFSSSLRIFPFCTSHVSLSVSAIADASSSLVVDSSDGPHNALILPETELPGSKFFDMMLSLSVLTRFEGQLTSAFNLTLIKRPRLRASTRRNEASSLAALSSIPYLCVTV